MISLLAFFDQLPENAVAVTEWTTESFIAIGVSLTAIAYMIYFRKTNPEKD